MSRIKEYPSITSFDGTEDALAIEQTDGANNRTRKVSPAQLKQYIEAGNFAATGEVEDGDGNVLSDIANLIRSALGGLKVRIKQVTLTDVSVSRSWGSLYESPQQNINISDLGFNTVYGAFITASQATGSIILELSGASSSTVTFYLVRGTSAQLSTVKLAILVVGV